MCFYYFCFPRPPVTKERPRDAGTGYVRDYRPKNQNKVQFWLCSVLEHQLATTPWLPEAQKHFSVDSKKSPTRASKLVVIFLRLGLGDEKSSNQNRVQLRLCTVLEQLLATNLLVSLASLFLSLLASLFLSVSPHSSRQSVSPHYSRLSRLTLLDASPFSSVSPHPSRLSHLTLLVLHLTFLVCLTSLFLSVSPHSFTFTFSHLADAFIQSDLQLGNT